MSMSDLLQNTKNAFQQNVWMSSMRSGLKDAGSAPQDIQSHKIDKYDTIVASELDKANSIVFSLNKCLFWNAHD